MVKMICYYRCISFKYRLWRCCWWVHV